MIYILILAIWIIIVIISLVKCIQYLDVTWTDDGLLYITLILTLLEIVLKV